MKKTARLEVKKEKQKAKHSNTFNPFSLLLNCLQKHQLSWSIKTKKITEIDFLDSLPFLKTKIN